MTKVNQTGMDEKTITKSQLTETFKELNIAKEDLLIIYGDLSQSNHVIGGSQSVIEALYEELEGHATIVMPAHSTGQTCPTFFNEALSPEQLTYLKDQIPAFNKELTTISSGELAKTFAINNQVSRSEHPITSFLALGRKSEWVLSNHSLDSMFGEKSPLQKLYAQGAKILCLDTDYQSITALHYMEAVANCRQLRTHEAIINEKGERAHVEFEDLDYNSKDFNEIGRHFEESKNVLISTAGTAICRLIDFREIIDFGAEYLTKNN